MASRDRATDEDVAQLLAKEAKEASKKYSEVGVRALLPTRPTTAAPKPNTRFLKNIIRETDSHNLALKKKEELEARVRLRLRTVNDGESASATATATATANRRGYGDERHRKRRRVEEEGDEDEGRERGDARKRRSRERRDAGSAERSGSSETDDERRRRRRRTRRRSREIYRGGDGYSRGKLRHYEEQHGSGDREKRSRRVRDVRDAEERGRSHHTKRPRRSSSRESKISDGESHHRHHRRKERGYRTHRVRGSAPSDMSRSPRREDRRPGSRTPPGTGGGNGVARKNGTSLAAAAAAAPDSDSDPLEALVGPLPPPGTSTTMNDPPPLRSRGRGAYKPNASAMDQHFSATYDPSLDLRPDSEESEGEDEKEDWDMALEALRDREIWKQKGAERLRAAGFGDEEIKKWEGSGREKGAEDVKWTRKGEAREWDRGKIVEEAAGGGERKGEVGLEEAWKRKGGGFLKDFKKALG